MKVDGKSPACSFENDIFHPSRHSFQRKAVAKGLRMRKIFLPLSAAFLVVLTFGFPVQADESPDSSAPQAESTPKRETDLISIFEAAAKEYAANHEATRAQDVRLEVQVRTLRFMRENQTAEDWTGVVKTRGSTPEGDLWISIEIADGITVSTWKSNIDDAGATTLLRQGSKLFLAAQKMKIGQRIKFSGSFLKSVMAEDEDMILRPEFIMLFTDFKS
jgi:hypothetical protein